MYNGTTEGHGSFSGNPSPEVNYLLDVRSGAPIEAPVSVQLSFCSVNNFDLAVSIRDGCPSRNSSTEILNLTNYNTDTRYVAVES